MAADIQDVEANSVAAEWNDVERIAGQLVTRSVTPGELQAGDGGSYGRQERLLDLRGGLQVARHPAVDTFQSGVGFLHLDLQASELQVRLDASVQFFHLKGLRDVVHPPAGERIHLVVIFVERADEDDGNAPES